MLKSEDSRKEYDQFIETNGKFSSDSTFNQNKYTNKISIDDMYFEGDMLCVKCEQCGTFLEIDVAFIQVNHLN